jgi:TetR/AcrR family transcriptional repressor of nem operon
MSAIKQKATQDTKQILIDTASELIWKSSYGAVSVDDICKAANVKKGSFYHFFPSKVDLALAALEEFYQSKKMAYDKIFSPQTPALKRFEQMADFVVELQEKAAAKHGQVCGCPHASLGCEMAGQEDSIRQKLQDLTGRFERYYESAIRDLIADGTLPKDTDVKAKAQEVFTYLMGQLTFARIQNDINILKRDFKPGLLRIFGINRKANEAA